MKRLGTILTICLLSLSFVGANAQGVFNWGVKAGLNVSSLASYDDAEYKPGFNVGVMGQYMFRGTEGFGLEAALQYSMLGFKHEDLDKTYHASYIQLPVQAIYKFGVGTDLYLYPSAGVYLGYGVGGSKFNYMDVGGEDKYFDVAENFDFGFKVGVNLQFLRNFLVGVTYERGITEVFNDTKNQNFGVSVGYLF